MSALAIPRLRFRVRRRRRPPMHPVERAILTGMIVLGGRDLADYIRHGDTHELISAAGCSLYVWYALRADPLRRAPGMLVAVGVIWTAAGMSLLGL